MKYQYTLMLSTVMAIVSLQTLPSANSYVTSGLPGHKHRAWLTEMTIEVCDTTPGELSQEMCNKAPQLLSAWAQNPYVPHTKHKTDTAIYPHHGKECAILCEKLLKRIVDERRAGNQNAVTSTETYNALINVWSRSGEKAAAAQRAESIVIGMQDAYTSGQHDVQPDLESFRHVLKAWSQAKGEEDAPYRAQRLLDWMIRLYNSGENDLVQPDSDCFDLVIQSFANSNLPEAPQMTEKLIMFMDRQYHNGNKDAKPTRMSFNQVLTAWARSKASGSAQRASDILERMIVLSNHDRDLIPSIASFTAVIGAWAKSGDDDCGRKAERILKQAERRYRMGEGEIFTPDTVMYNLVIDAHSKTSSNKKHLRSRDVLDRQTKLYNSGNKKCKPDVYTFTSVLGSCASLGGSRKEKMRAFEIAHSTFLQMSRSNVIPNHVSYGSMMKSCSRLLPMGKDRRMYTREYFRKACEDGCVGDMVLRRLESASSQVQYKGLLKGFTQETLPKDWVRNVPERDRKSKKFKQNKKNKNKNNKSAKNELRP